MFAGPVVVRRRPLLRAAAIGGTYAAGREMGRRMQERQYERSAQDGRAPAPLPPTVPADAPMLDQLTRLTVLYDQGELNDQEFAAAKAKVLANFTAG